MGDQAEMKIATWTTVEALGIPDSPMRKFLFELADFMDGRPGGDQLALASAAFTGLAKEFREQFMPKSPLQQQLDHIRVSRELEEMVGVSLPAIPGDQFELRIDPETPIALARELGYSDGRAVRRVLGEGFPGHAKNAKWEPLTRQQVNYVRAHLSARDQA